MEVGGGTGSEVDTFTSARQLPERESPTRSPRGRHPERRPLPPDKHRQSIASRSQFGQSSAQTAATQALRNKKKEYEAISALEQSCTGLIATLGDITTDLNTTTEAIIGTAYTP